MDAGDALRLAWEAEHDGRTQLREALLTLAVTESRHGDAWAERCRSRLISDRPNHFLGQFASIGLALEDPRVIMARDRLRLKYPECRVQWLLLKARAARGPYLGRVESLEAMVEDLAGPMAEVENVRRDAAQVSRGPIHLQKAARPVVFALSYPPMPLAFEPSTYESSFEDGPEPLSEEFATYYLTVLLAIACLLATVQERRSAED